MVAFACRESLSEVKTYSVQVHLLGMRIRTYVQWSTHVYKYKKSTSSQRGYLSRGVFQAQPATPTLPQFLDSFFPLGRDPDPYGRRLRRGCL